MVVIARWERPAPEKSLTLRRVTSLKDLQVLQDRIGTWLVNDVMWVSIKQGNLVMYVVYRDAEPLFIFETWHHRPDHRPFIDWPERQWWEDTDIYPAHIAPIEGAAYWFIRDVIGSPPSHYTDRFRDRMGFRSEDDLTELTALLDKEKRAPDEYLFSDDLATLLEEPALATLPHDEFMAAIGGST